MPEMVWGLQPLHTNTCLRSPLPFTTARPTDCEGGLRGDCLWGSIEGVLTVREYWLWGVLRCIEGLLTVRGYWGGIDCERVLRGVLTVRGYWGGIDCEGVLRHQYSIYTSTAGVNLGKLLSYCEPWYSICSALQCQAHASETFQLTAQPLCRLFQDCSSFD